MKVISVFARLSLIPLIIALTFKAMNWPGALFLMIVSPILLLFFYGIKFLKTREKITSDYLKIATIIGLSIYILIDIVLGHDVPGLNHLYKILLLAYLITKFHYEGASSKQNILATILFGIGVLLLAAGFLFKLMHWPGGSASLIFSSMIGMLWVIASLFNKNYNESPKDEINEIGKS